MREIGSDPRVLSLVKIHGISNIIDSLENQLNRCQSTLTAFINVCINLKKRTKMNVSYCLILMNFSIQI